MHVTGACHCGAITFEAEVDEGRVFTCHCTDCQVIASTAFRFGAIVRRETFSMRGPYAEYAKIGTTGQRRMQVFCPTCATGIYSYSPDGALPFLSLRLGGVHQRAQLAPVQQIWYRSALPWVAALNDIPRCNEQEILLSMLGLAQPGAESLPRA
jgi:hypothetical protein